MAKIANELGLSRAAVATWPVVPAERVIRIAEITGISPADLRPDLAAAFAQHLAANASVAA